MIKIFIDFDGTISRRDVGDALFETFGGQRSVIAVEQYRDKKLSAAECFRRECEACGEVDRSRLLEFLNEQEIDPAFAPFISFCRQHSLKHYIVSDGMDFYIRQILHRHGLGDVPLFANKLDLISVEDSSSVRFVPSFPFTDEVCDRCACCKRNHMLTLSGEDDFIVYIGEGYSDRCPVRYADMVFAKEDLLKYCRQENISFFEYQSFADITKRLTSFIHPAEAVHSFTPRKRRRAELERRRVFIGG